MQKAILRRVAVFDVRREQGKTLPAGLKADDVRRAGELLGRVSRVVGRQHDLPRQPGGLHPPSIVEKGQPLGVAPGPGGDVADGQSPIWPQEILQQHADARRIPLDLLDGDDVQAADHLGDVGQRPQVALGRAGVLLPAFVHLPKAADVPGADEQVVVGRLARQAGTLDAPPQPGDILDDGAGVGL